MGRDHLYIPTNQYSTISRVHEPYGHLCGYESNQNPHPFRLSHAETHDGTLAQGGMFAYR